MNRARHPLPSSACRTSRIGVDSMSDLLKLALILSGAAVTAVVLLNGLGWIAKTF